MDSYIGKLRSIFAEAGRQGDWNRTLLPGNPATDDLVTIYLKQVTVEQLLARVTPKQAVPFFPDKLFQLSNHLKRRLAPLTLNTSEQFVTATSSPGRFSLAREKRPGDEVVCYRS